MPVMSIDQRVDKKAQTTGGNDDAEDEDNQVLHGSSKQLFASCKNLKVT